MKALLIAALTVFALTGCAKNTFKPWPQWAVDATSETKGGDGGGTSN